MVHGYIRQLGWRRGLTISFPSANTTVRVYSENWLSGLWENCCCNLLCHLTIVPCLVMRIYRGDCCCQTDHAEGDIRSFFRIQYAPLHGSSRPSSSTCGARASRAPRSPWS